MDSGSGRVDAAGVGEEDAEGVSQVALPQRRDLENWKVSASSRAGGGWRGRRAGVEPRAWNHGGRSVPSAALPAGRGHGRPGHCGSRVSATSRSAGSRSVRRRWT